MKTINVSDDVYERLSAGGGENVSGFAEMLLDVALKANMTGGGHYKVSQGKIKEQLQKEGQKAKLNELFDNALLKQFENNPEVIGELEPKTLADLVVRRLPKVQDINADLERDLLNLQDCLNKLPAIDDLTKELGKLRSDIKRWETHDDLQNYKLTLTRMKKQGMFSELHLKHLADLEAAFTSYVKDCKARDYSDIEPFKFKI